MKNVSEITDKENLPVPVQAESASVVKKLRKTGPLAKLKDTSSFHRVIQQFS
jgi:hypothetical protein